MYKNYYFYNYVDSKGNHEVHTGDCSYLPAVENRTYIGLYNSCSDAISAAKKQYPLKSFDGCYFCCTSCHKG